MGQEAASISRSRRADRAAHRNRANDRSPASLRSLLSLQYGLRATRWSCGWAKKYTTLLPHSRRPDRRRCASRSKDSDRLHGPSEYADPLWKRVLRRVGPPGIRLARSCGHCRLNISGDREMISVPPDFRNAAGIEGRDRSERHRLLELMKIAHRVLHCLAQKRHPRALDIATLEAYLGPRSSPPKRDAYELTCGVIRKAILDQDRARVRDRLDRQAPGEKETVQ